VCSPPDLVLEINVTQHEADSRLQEAFQQLFFGDPEDERVGARVTAWSGRCDGSVLHWF
jgi:hypothetical protein